MWSNCWRGCERREVPFPTFSTCSRLHKPQSAEPEVAMPTWIVPPIHLPMWTMPEGAGVRPETHKRSNGPAAEVLLHWWGRLKDSVSCVYPWPLCHQRETAPEQQVCSTSASMSRVLYLCCWIWFQVLTDSTESVLLPIKGITSSAWVCVPAFPSVALK